MANLRAAGLLAPKKLGQVPVAQLERLLRPAGYFRQKARYVAQFVRHLNGGNDGSVTRLLRGSTRKLRSELLALAGVGPETADSILLYAGGRPVFVIDAYTRRVLSRHGLADAKAPYDALQDFFHGNLPRNGALFNEFHAQFVAVGKTFCHKRNPDCAACPLGPELERINARG
jgi:endonuclease-3 related protein